jgi:2-aminoadipate transaminase
VAWLIAPAAIAHKVELAKQAANLCSGVFDQRIVHAALERGVVRAIAPSLRQHYQARRTIMEQALSDELGARVRWSQPRGGFFLWAEFEQGVDDRALFDRAVQERVSFVQGSAFFVYGEGHRLARLAFSAASPERIREGIGRLRVAVVAAAAVRSRG